MPELDTELESLKIPRMADPVRRPQRSPRALIVLLTLSLAGVAAATAAYIFRTSAPKVEVMRVLAAQDSAPSDAPVVLNDTGYIIAHHEIQVASKVSGKVASIGVEEGDLVKKGQVLVRLDDSEYRAQLLQAKGSLDSLKAKLMELEHGSRPQEITQADANLRQSQADLTNSRFVFERDAALFSQGIISRADFDNAQYKYRNLQAQVNALEQSYDLVRKGPREEEIDSMKGQVEQAQGALAYDEDQESNTVIRSPIDGCVLERAVEQGEFVTNGFVGDKGAKGYVVTLADPNDLQVELDISQNDFAQVHLGSKAIITTDAFPDRKYEGKLVEISPIANRQKATVQVKVQILHPDAYLKPEMNASVAFVNPEAGQQQQHETGAAITIPSSAVRDQSVFVVTDNRARIRRVQVARTSQQGVRIAQGLSPGEDLIVNPPANLTDGEKVRVEGDQP
ncbi:MAG TPA: efflux RND transporter periplasmic adaptor subunit [Terriglobales bacterium]|nr:efflux RND transporter periplasmic adaptor subunit [Terriglobales bacterium]